MNKIEIKYETILQTLLDLGDVTKHANEYLTFKQFVKRFCIEKNIPLSIFETPESISQLQQYEIFKTTPTFEKLWKNSPGLEPYFLEPFKIRTKLTECYLYNTIKGPNYKIPLGEIVKKVPYAFFHERQTPHAMIFFIYDFPCCARISKNGNLTVTGGCNNIQIALSYWYFASTVQSVINEIEKENGEDELSEFVLTKMRVIQIFSTNKMPLTSIDTVNLSEHLSKVHQIKYRYNNEGTNGLFYVTPYKITLLPINTNDIENNKLNAMAIRKKNITVSISAVGGMNIYGVVFPWEIQFTALIMAYLIKDFLRPKFDRVANPTIFNVALKEWIKSRIKFERAEIFRKRLAKIKAIADWTDKPESQYKRDLFADVFAYLEPDKYMFEFPKNLNFIKNSIKDWDNINLNDEY